jgi:hypothetical protein
MQVIDRKSPLWVYLQDDIRGLVSDGEHLLSLVTEEEKNVTDFSYLVFSFSKAYEGFLKKLFLDTGVINEKDYYGDDVRIGRILSPNYRRANLALFDRICLKERGSADSSGKDLADRLWSTWHRGRNRVFHYFPHNFRRLGYDEAFEIVMEVCHRMEESVVSCGLSVETPITSLV